MTPRQIASDLQMSWHHLANCCCATFCRSNSRLFLIPPPPPRAVGRRLRRGWNAMVGANGRQPQAPTRPLSMHIRNDPAISNTSSSDLKQPPTAPQRDLQDLRQSTNPPATAGATSSDRDGPPAASRLHRDVTT